MSKQSVKPVLLSEAQIQAIRKFRNSSASNQVLVLRQLSMKSLGAGGQSLATAFGLRALTC